MTVEYGDGMLCCQNCGTDGIPEVGFLVTQRFVRCRTCGAASPRRGNIVDAKAAWNNTQKALAAAEGEGGVSVVSDPTMPANTAIIRSGTTEVIITNLGVEKRPYIRNFGFMDGMVGPICKACGLRHATSTPTSAVDYCAEARSRHAEWQRKNRETDVTGRKPFVDPMPCRIFPKEGDNDEQS